MTGIKGSTNIRKDIQMVDLRTQYQNIRTEIDREISEVLSSAQFIGGPKVIDFAKNLASYLDAKQVIGCANGTDALQIALMALNLKSGDEVIVPSFTYVATAEVIALLGLKPIMVDVNYRTFNMSVEDFENTITEKTKAIIPVHLFGQSCDMDSIMELAEAKGISVIEDNAQSIGAKYFSKKHGKQMTGTIGHIGTSSFYPSKNLACYGDGGAIITNDPDLGNKIKMIANHGQEKKYYHSLIGCNSRLDALQAGILNVKLKYLDSYIEKRRQVAKNYNLAFKQIDAIELPFCHENCDHIYHQYTLKIKDGRRDSFKTHLSDVGIPSMVYYPVPLYEQKAFAQFTDVKQLPVTDLLCKEVISLPIHTELSLEQQNYIIDTVINYFQ